MRFSLVKEGLFNRVELDAWTRESRERIFDGVAAGMKEAGAEIVPKLRERMRAGLKLNKRGLEKSVRAKVHTRRKDVLPVMDLGSAVPWLGIHERGGTIRGPLLIPLLDTRIGYQKFKQVVATIIRNGAGFFKRMDDGRVILFAEYQPEYGKPLARFRRLERSRRGSIVRKGEDIPIAVLVPQVTLKARLNFEGTVRSNLGVIADAIERNIARGA